MQLYADIGNDQGAFLVVDGTQWRFDNRQLFLQVDTSSDNAYFAPHFNSNPVPPVCINPHPPVLDESERPVVRTNHAGGRYYCTCRLCQFASRMHLEQATGNENFN